jgi:hypothetical protein
MFKKLKFFIVEKVFGRITRKIRLRRRLKELKKRDPYIYP